MDGPGYSFLREVAFAPRQPAGAADTRPHIGAVQSLFPQDVPTGPERPPLNDKDLMKSLPYQ